VQDDNQTGGIFSFLTFSKNLYFLFYAIFFCMAAPSGSFMVIVFFSEAFHLRWASLSFGSPKESEQRKGDPWRGAMDRGGGFIQG